MQACLVIVASITLCQVARSVAEWSEPLNMGEAINSEFNDQQPAPSPDGLSLYFASDRPDGSGNYDIYVSRRASLDAPWQPAQNLGPPINTASIDRGPILSPDGHWLLFASDRPGTLGLEDIWASWRADVTDDFAWQEPKSLGPPVNTPEREGTPFLFHDNITGLIVLYFAGINRPGGLGDFDIYASIQNEDGSFQEPQLIREVSTKYFDSHPCVTRDGLAMFLDSRRPGGIGGIDIWVSTRESANDVWRDPVNIGPPINTEYNAFAPTLSSDEQTLFFTSNRPGSLGGSDIFYSMRKK